MTTLENEIKNPSPDHTIQRYKAGILERLDRFENREWFISGVIVLILILLFTQLILILLPSEKIIMPEIAPVTDLKFVEYQEIQTETPAETQDLSDEIIEKEKKDDLKKINWENAADPTFDTSQRYRPLFRINFSEDDYPQRARRSNLPRVIVTFSMLVGANGQIQDVRIRKIRSLGNAHIPFERDFRKAVRKIIMRQTKLLTRPYTAGGVGRQFKWDYKIEFVLKN